jgi:uridine kinase
VPTEATYDDLLARVRALISTSEAIPVVGISGHGGSGKSTLAAKLVADLGLLEDQVVATDAFYATTCGPDAGLWEQYDWPLIEALVRGARAVPPPQRLRYDYRWWSGESGVEDHPMPPVLIVEGIRILGDRTRDWFELTAWIDMDPDAAGVRAVARNTGQGDDQAELDLWRTKWIPEGWEYERLVRPRERADLVVRSDVEERAAAER